jgi:hypothetical protein
VTCRASAARPKCWCWAMTVKQWTSLRSRSTGGGSLGMVAMLPAVMRGAYCVMRKIHWTGGVLGRQGGGTFFWFGE